MINDQKHELLNESRSNISEEGCARTSIRVLIIEDSEPDTVLLVRALRRANYAVTFERADNPDSVTALLSRSTWDLIISDYSMPNFRGTDALKIVKNRGLDIPFIFVSGTIDEDTAIEAMKAGAHDYVMKGNLKRLLPAIERELAEAEVRRARRQAEKDLSLRNERIRALYEIDKAITSTLNLQTVMDVLLEKIDQLIPYSVASTVRLLKKEAGQLEFFACRNIDEHEWTSQLAVPRAGRSRQVLETKKPVVIRNLLGSPITHNPAVYSKHGLVSCIGLPLLVQDEALGVLNLFTKEEHQFTDEEVEFLMTLAGQAAVAIHNAELYEQTERQLKRVEALREIDKAMNSTLKLTDVLNTVLEGVEGSCPFAAATGVRLFEKETKKMIPLAARNISLEEWKGDLVQSSGELIETILASKAPIVIANLARDARTTAHMFARKHGLVSYLGIPLIVKDEVIGTLVIYTTQEHAFTTEEIEFCATLGGQAAIAIQNAKLYLQTEQHLKRIEALREIDRAIASTLDVSAVLDVLLEKINVFLPFPATTTIRLLNRVTGKFENTACRNIDEQEWKAARGGRTGQLSREILVTKGPLIIRNIQTDTQRKASEFFRKQGFVSYLGVPLSVKDDIVGILGFYTKKFHEFNRQEIDWLLTLAGQGAIAIHNAQLFQEIGLSNAELEKTTRSLGRSLKQLGGLYTALTPIAPASTIEQMMDGIVERIVDATGADAGLIRVWDKDADGYPIIAQRGFPDDYRRRVIAASRGGAVDWVIKHDQPIIATDIASDPRLKGKAQTQLGLRSCAVLPLKVDDDVRGVIHISSRKKGYFEETQRDHLLAMARQMSVTLENRKLFYDLKASKDDLERANKVKDEFLSVVSHELRTPINLIAGYTSLLKDQSIGQVNPAQADALQKISRVSSDLLAMVDNILYATLLEAAQFRVETQEFSPANLLEEVAGSHEVSLPKGVSMIRDYERDLPPIKTDGNKLKHILNNLINNAIKFTQQGQVTISAKLFEETSNPTTERWVAFTVADTGVGIPKESLPKICDKFYQVDGSPTRHYGGTGMGLYIVKKFTELLGGSIAVESEVGLGSTFTITIPAD